MKNLISWIVTLKLKVDYESQSIHFYFAFLFDLPYFPHSSFFVKSILAPAMHVIKVETLTKLNVIDILNFDL